MANFQTVNFPSVEGMREGDHIELTDAQGNKGVWEILEIFPATAQARLWLREEMKPAPIAGTLADPVRLDFSEQPLSEQLWVTRPDITEAKEFGQCRLTRCTVPGDDMPLKFNLSLFGHELHWEQYMSDKEANNAPDADCLAMALQGFAKRIIEGEIR